MPHLDDIWRATSWSGSPYVAAARGLIDDVIEPPDTRRILIQALELTRSKREAHPERKHGIAPS